MIVKSRQWLWGNLPPMHDEMQDLGDDATLSRAATYSGI